MHKHISSPHLAYVCYHPDWLEQVTWVSCTLKDKEVCSAHNEAKRKVGILQGSEELEPIIRSTVDKGHTGYYYYYLPRRPGTTDNSQEGQSRD